MSATAAARVTDIYTTSLILIEGCSTHTGFHLDWTEAKNIAFATCKVCMGQLAFPIGLDTCLTHCTKHAIFIEAAQVMRQPVYFSQDSGARLLLNLLVMQEDLGIVLAVWIFLHPAAAHTADVWLRNNGHKDGFSTAGKVHLAAAMIDQLSLHLGKDQRGQPYCIKIE